jgi:hypothetical protein
MEPFLTVADLFLRTALDGRANSALPNAPVQAIDERPNLTTRLGAVLRKRVHRPRVEIRQAQYSPGCSSP